MSCRAAACVGIALAGLLGASLPASAQHLPAVEAEHYARCMEKARHDPKSARDDALAWRDTGGGHPAEHCAAVALIGLKQYKEAATQLEGLADAMFKDPPALRAGVLDQAGQAWLLAGNAPRAAALATRAVALVPDDPDLRIDRAEALAGERKFADAIADLDHALAADPHRVDALVFRAAAHREEGQLAAALSDADAALALAPDQPDALLERGNIHRLKGDLTAARRDWTRLATTAPGSPAAKAARDNIAKLAEKGGAASPAPAPRQ